MEQFGKIPVVVGVTGHLNICADERDSLLSKVKVALQSVRNLLEHNDTPVVMLCGMARGADMLCAQAAFEMDIPVYAVLPFEKERFYDTFGDSSDRDSLYPYLGKCARIIQTPDIEQNKDWFMRKVGTDEDSYWYRQVGIYIAEHSHITLALWDGNPAKLFGCGTAEVIKFTIENNYLIKDRLLAPSMVTDSAVIWIKTNRETENGKQAHLSNSDDTVWLSGEYGEDDTKKRKNSKDKVERYQGFVLTNAAPKFLVDEINETVAYNKAQVKENKPKPPKKSRSEEKPRYDLWDDVDGLNEYHKNVREHYIKADKLSYAINQPKYKHCMLALAILGAFIAWTFLVYDDAELIWMIAPCTVAVNAVVALSLWSKSKAYHENYIKYRAFAEALRIQFYLSLSLDEHNVTNVCDLYSWSQKVKNVWIRKAIGALDVISDDSPMVKSSDFIDKVKDAWIGNGENPQGQLRYHTKKKKLNKKQCLRLNNVTKALTWTTFGLYTLMLIFEMITLALEMNGKSFFWTENSPLGLSYRIIGIITVGTLAATSLLLSSYWGKLSFDRLYDDNEKMSMLYQSAHSRWGEIVKDNLHSTSEFKNFVKEIAREEIVENGIWCSYVSENTLDINL